MRTIYLDYNATTPIAPAVQQAILPYLAEHFGNPSSSYSLGLAAHEAVETARLKLARLLDAKRDEIVFTSGGSESNNFALKGFLGPLLGGSSPVHLVISALEHPAVAAPARYLERLGCRLSVVGCDRRGLVDPDEIEKAFTSHTRLVSVMLANNEIGTLQPIAEIAARCRARGVAIHTDAAQAVGKIGVNVAELDVDLLSIAGHKCYAPKGIGALYVRRGVRLEPLVHGAGHEAGQRAGTECVPLIVALGEAAELAARHLEEAGRRMARLRDRLENRLAARLGAALRVNGAGAPRLPNTLSVCFPGVAGHELLHRIPELSASTGSACHSASSQGSATQAALGLSADEIRGTIRLSVGWYTTDDEINRAAELLLAAWEDLQ